MRKLVTGCLSLLSAFPAMAAFADPLPVVAVNREVGLSMAGLFDNRVSGGSQSYTAAPTLYAPAYHSYSHGSNRRIGWVPGFQVDASTMFTLGRVENIYASAQFVLGSGTRNYKSRSTYQATGYYPQSTGYYPQSWAYGDGDDSHSTYTRGELGKGFLLVNNTLLITPFAQGGYITEGINTYGNDGTSSFAGAGVRADYALTSRLVLRGRFGWAALLDKFYLISGTGVRSRWEGGLGLDYRLTRHFHLIGGGDYAYTDHGRGSLGRYYNGTSGAASWDGSASAFQNGLNLHAGLAYQY